MSPNFTRFSLFDSKSAFSGYTLKGSPAIGKDTVSKGFHI